MARCERNSDCSTHRAMKPTRSPSLTAALTAIALLCGACTSSNDAATDARIVLSCARSASQWLDSWLDGTSPSSYARRSVDSASEQVGKIAGELQSSEPVAQIRGVQAAFDAARTALNSGDRARVQQARSTLNDATIRLDAWMRAHPGSAS